MTPTPHPAQAMRHTLRLSSITPLALALVLAGCASLAPDYQRPAAPVPGALPTASSSGDQLAVPAAWDQLVLDARAQGLVRLALQHNRDLRVAQLNLEKARAQLRISEADRYPTVNGVLAAQRAPNTSGQLTNTFQAGLNVSSYEVDLWGRVNSSNQAAQASLLASDASRRATELAVVAGVSAAYLSLAADEELLALAERTLATRQETLKLTQLRVKVGAAADPELRVAESLVAQSQAALAQQQRQRLTDENSLALLIGQAVPPELRPARAAAGTGPSALPDSALLTQSWLGPVVPGTRSEVLLQRPDLIAAEQQLVAANANIGAARAAMFPRIALTGSAGMVSSELSDLFSSGSFAWSLASQAAVALFDAGRNRANVKVAEVNRDIAVAQYEKAIQTAFKEAADSIVGLDSWRQQLVALQDQLASERDRARLTQLRYERGAASALELLDSQRSLYGTEQAVIQTRLAELQNRLALYKALGGWQAAAAQP
jgi:outer membrane protein, multidrug efflux system